MGIGTRAAKAAAAAALVGASLVVLAGPAAAAITTTVSGATFTTSMSAPGSVTVTCSGANQILVNGSAIGLACSAMHGFTINGSSGVDTIDVSGVTSPAFPNATGNMDVFGNAGNDILTGGGITASNEPYIALDGGPGDDHLSGGTGKTTIFGGPGDDTIVGGSYYTSITGGPGRDTVHGGSGYDSVYVEPGDLPDAVITGGTGGALLDLRSARHIWVKGKATNGCDAVLATDTQARFVSVDAGFTACQVSDFGDVHDLVIAGLAPATGIDVGIGLGAALPIDLYTAGAATTSNAGHTISRAGYAPVTISTYSGATFDLTLHQTYPAPSSQQAFIHSVLRDLNGVQASNSAIAAASALFTSSGSTRLQYATDRTATAEWRGLQVDRAYRTFLGRTPDAGGRTYWIGRLASGTRVWELRSNLMASPEFYTSSGGNPTAFVSAVYQLVLGRAPDPGGLAYWVGRLNSGDPRSAVSSSLLTASESLQAEVGYQFRLLIGRDPTPTELTTWAPILRDQPTGDAQLDAFLAASGSYAGRAS